MNTPAQSAVIDHGDEFNQSPEALIQWLEAKYQRHHEDEDRQVADLLKKLIAEKPADNSLAIVAGAKHQAKRLLKLSKEKPLKLTALNEALEVVSRLHGYPDWQALSSSASRKDASVSGEKIAKNESVPHSKPSTSHILINDKSHLRDLRRMLSRKDTVCTLITPHFSDIQTAKNPNSVELISLDRLIKTNPFLSPLGMEKMLPAHRDALARVLASVLPAHESQMMRSIIAVAIDLAFEDAYSVRNAQPEDQTYWPVMFPVSSRTQHKIEHLGEISARDATHYLIGMNELDAAQEIHAQCMPKISNFLMNLEKAAITTGLPKDTWMPCIENLIKILGKSDIANKSFDLPIDRSWVIEVDPTDVDRPLSAETRWMLAAFLDEYRHMSDKFNNEYNTIAANAYRADLSWVMAIPATLRQHVVKLHADQARIERSRFYSLFFDEMDGPIYSQKICDAAAIIFREYRKQYNCSVSIATKAQKCAISSVNPLAKSGAMTFISDDAFNLRLR